MSIRLRLTGLYTGLMAVALVLFSFLLYNVQQWTFTQAVDSGLQNVAEKVAIHFRSYNRLPDMNSLGDKSTFVLVRTANSVIDKSSNVLGMFPLPDAARNGTETYTTERDLSGETYRLYTMPMYTVGFAPVYVQVADNLNTLDIAADRVRLPLGIGTTVFVALAAIAVWFVSGRAIEPIEKVATAAEMIGESADLSLRVPYQGPEDEVGRLVATFNDMLDQLQGMYGRLAASIDTQQRFVADASHELRTPLTIIRGNIDYLQRAKVLDPEALADMASESERLSRMVDELLTMARADAGQEMQLQPLMLGPLVGEACRKAQAMPHTVAFQTELPEALDLIAVKGNGEWLTRMLLILIDNAFKYTPSGSVTVRAGRQGDGVVVQVQDTGMGISREDLPHVFERFYRADRARARGGAGLGLAIAQWAATTHHGRLTVESELGKGSTFTLWLPIFRGEA
ncbi:MAG: two-component sensor histidine kinase [Symbiobacteriaceae bacterium]|nr:two-component sensor histidine kinase [Symbiobacteriaceae bacterium]